MKRSDFLRLAVLAPLASLIRWQTEPTYIERTATAPVIRYVNASASPGGDGSIEHPYASLAEWERQCAGNPGFQEVRLQDCGQWQGWTRP